MNWMYSRKRKEMLNRTFVVWPLRNIADCCFKEYGINKTMRCHRKGSLRRGFWEFPPLSALLEKWRKSGNV